MPRTNVMSQPTSVASRSFRPAPGTASVPFWKIKRWTVLLSELGRRPNAEGNKWVEWAFVSPGRHVPLWCCTAHLMFVPTVHERTSKTDTQGLLAVNQTGGLHGVLLARADHSTCHAGAARVSFCSKLPHAPRETMLQLLSTIPATAVGHSSEARGKKRCGVHTHMSAYTHLPRDERCAFPPRRNPALTVWASFG
jgi:hypothetical protein